MKKYISNFIEDERGATAVEYGLIVGLIAVVIVTVLSQIGTALNIKLNNIVDALK